MTNQMFQRGSLLWCLTNHILPYRRYWVSTGYTESLPWHWLHPYCHIWPIISCLTGDIESAQGTLNHSLDIDSTHIVISDQSYLVLQEILSQHRVHWITASILTPPTLWCLTNHILSYRRYWVSTGYTESLPRYWLHPHCDVWPIISCLTGDIESAQGTLNHCLDIDSTHSDAHIMMAQIHLFQNNFKLANQSLEVGLSYNFEVSCQFILTLISMLLVKIMSSTIFNQFCW